MRKQEAIVVEEGVIEVEQAKSETKPDNVNDIPGVGAATAEKLVSSGYDTLLSVAVTSPRELVAIAGVTDVAARKMIQYAREKLDLGFESGEDVLRKREGIEKIYSGSKALDSLLGGGFETRAITESFGQYGSGKSQLAHALSAHCLKQYPDAAVVFIDTESTFRPERITQMAKSIDLDPEDALKRIKTARAFNSLLGSEKVCITNDESFHIEPIEDVVGNRRGRSISTFAFNPESGKMEKVKVTDLIEHELGENNLMYKITTSFGREVTVTGSHSVFKGVRMGKLRETVNKIKGNMRPVPEYANFLREGDYIALPNTLPVPGKDVGQINFAEELINSASPEILKEILVVDCDQEHLLSEITNNSVRQIKFLKLRHTGRGVATRIPNVVEVNEDVLWLLGFIIAEGDSQYKRRFLRFRLTSEPYLIEKAKRIIEANFNVKSFIHSKKNYRARTLLVPSRLLCLIMRYCYKLPIEKVAFEKSLPEWIFELPLSKLKHFVAGFWDGDGYHAASRPKGRLLFATSSRELANGLSMLLLRFGVVAGINPIKLKNPKPNWHVPYRVEAAGLNIDDPLKLEGAAQHLNAPVWNDLVFARIKKIEEVKLDPKTKVYDFEVNSPQQPYQNFVGGFGGVICHNSDHQMILAEKVEDLIKQGLNVKLVVVDSLTAHFRAEFIGRGTLADRQQKINKHLHTLMKLAEMYNLAVYVTNQVMSKPDVFFGDPTQAIGGHIVAHASTYRMYLRRGKKGSRVAKLVDSPNLPEAEAAFYIDESGIKDI
ncbi:hypothetical protein HYX10_01740 [Candidatus Woesearchaeota archaeon]|nr:hypothetical protein [Candidatus Woesearchaeota archaeon]